MAVTAAEYARDRVDAVGDDPEARLALMRALYAPVDDDATHLPYRRAASAFMGWQLRRGLLRPTDADPPGSAWWRGMNARIMRDGWESRALAIGHPGPPSSPTVAHAVRFVSAPSARTWYRAHNASVVAAYLEHRDLAAGEGRTERFFMNVVLLRVLFAHALVAAPRLALSWLAPVAPRLGDPRLGMTGIFLSLSRVLPNRYPLNDDVESHLRLESGIGHLLDLGVILPRLPALYDWSARELGEPALRDLIADGLPAYAWPADDAATWRIPPRLPARLARRALPPPRALAER
ncbi:MAG: hypothetical protein AB7V42_00275 [Thermoleophilia bacterium]